MESTDTISAPKRSASSRDNSVFPTAVGPTRPTTRVLAINVCSHHGVAHSEWETVRQHGPLRTPEQFPERREGGATARSPHRREIVRSILQRDAVFFDLRDQPRVQ